MVYLIGSSPSSPFAHDLVFTYNVHQVTRKICAKTTTRTNLVATPAIFGSLVQSDSNALGESAKGDQLNLFVEKRIGEENSPN